MNWEWRLGALGDPRIRTDIRGPEAADAFIRVPASKYVAGDKREEFVLATDLWLSRYPITNSQFALFIAEQGYERRDFWSPEGWEWREENKITQPDYWRDVRFNGSNKPVVGVSWYEADAFARWAKGRPPTEWEWEAAARGQDGFEYPWGNEWTNRICNSVDAALGATSPVGIFPKSRSQAFGVDDLAGNVWEWCETEGGSNWVIRGGCSLNAAYDCRSAFRSGLWVIDGFQFVGFRVARGSVQPGAGGN